MGTDSKKELDLSVNAARESDHKEKWFDVPGYEGLYQLSNYGRVRSLPRNRSPHNNEMCKFYDKKTGKVVVSLSKNGVTVLHNIVTELIPIRTIKNPIK